MKPTNSLLRPETSGNLFVLAGLVMAFFIIPLAGHDALAQLVTGRLSTSVYTWEKFDTVGSSQRYLRGFQTVQLSATQGEVSLQTYFAGAISSPTEGAATRFYNLYLRWANIGKALDVSLGRQAVYAGVGTGTIDGIAAKVHLLQEKVTLIGFGGASPVIGYRGIRKDFHDNLSLGGQVVTTAVPGARIGVSYLNRREERDPYWTLRARDTSYLPMPYYVTFEPEAEELLGGNVYYLYEDLFSLYGRYDHDLKYERTARAEGGLRVNVTPQVSLTADYMHRLPRVSFNSIFSAFVQNAVDEIEGGVEYAFTPLVRAFGRIASVSYSDEKSTRWSLGVNSAYGAASYSGSNGYAGELQSVTLQGTYPVLGNTVVPSVGVSYASYKLNEDEATNSVWSLLLGAAYRPVSAFSIDFQGQWLANKIYAHDVRGFLKFNYWFKERLGLFGREGM
jgi:hypothetical protein